MSITLVKPDLDESAERPSLAPGTGDGGRGVRAWLGRVWTAVHPSPRVRRAAAFGGAAVPLVAAAVMGSQAGSGLGAAIDVVLMMAFVALVLCIAAGVLWLVTRVLTAVPRFVGWLGTAAAILVLLPAMAAGAPALALGGLGVIVIAAVLAGCVAGLTQGGGMWRKVVRGGVAAAAIASLAMLGLWFSQPGTSTPAGDVPARVAVAPIGEADPAQPGSFKVRMLTYGSGTDRRRPEFASGAALKTSSVDARPLLEGYRGWSEKLRRAYWGFGAEALPLNARVWAPEGPGPFPLVLVVHGNHNMTEYSDPGYAWLGELLASRGMIVAAVDENFLNTSAFTGNIPGETDARAWLVLEHLRQWRRWNAAPGNVFHGRVDLARIALIGHSRGGEAVAVAGAFNGMRRYPDDARIAFDYGFGIRAIAALAPTDGQYNPGERPVDLRNVHYLALQGGQDGDVSRFLGDRQYHRVRFNEHGEWFKASVYIARANHGQFNTVWGRNDFPAPARWFINTKPLMTGDEQRRIAAVCVSGFLEAALRDRRGYRALFRDNLASASAWLPKTTYRARYEDNAFRVLADYEDDVDVTTTSVPGGATQATGVSIWREQDAPLRRKEVRRNNVVYVGWKPDGKDRPAYALTLPDGYAAAAALDGSTRLVFDIAEVDENPDPDAKKKGKPQASRTNPLDLTIELKDRNGTVARLPLSRYGGVPLRPQTRYMKWAAMEKMYGATAEAVFETLALPLADFVTAAPGFVPAELQSITLAFERRQSGVVALDRFGFAR